MLAQATEKTSHCDTRTPTVISASQDLLNQFGVSQDHRHISSIMILIHLYSVFFILIQYALYYTF